MLKTQVRLATRLQDATDSIRTFAADNHRDDRGEVTSQTIVIALLVIAAVAAGGIIATRIGNEAAKIGG